MGNLPRELEKACLKAGSQYQFATQHKLSPQYVSDVLRGHRKPGPAMLKALGFRRVVSYEKVR